MKKRLCAAALALWLMCAMAAQAAAPLSGNMIKAAKAALACLAAGEYERVSSVLPFSGEAPDAAEWARFARNFSKLGAVQQEYAVAYWADGWRIAVPVSAPDSGGVEALMLLSDDGAAFNGYKYVTWAQVSRECAASERVIWDQEYVGSSPKVYG